MKLKWQRWLRDLGILLLVVVAIQWWQARDLPKEVIAPSLAGAGLVGEPMALSNWQGQPVLVHFWATWCPVCRLEEGSIASIAEDYPVIAVATTSGTADEIQAYLAKQGVSFPVMMDESGDIARHWGVRGVPATFVIDSAGKIDYATMGFSTETGLRIRLALAD
jgi:thiol-disulfide isomerase/thioredoxin